MRGQILEVAASGGTILGSDGNRYGFARSDWRGPGDPPAGATVDFIAGAGAATEIFPLPGAASVPPTQARGAAPRPSEGSSVVLGILGIVSLLLGFVIPLLPTIVAFILGLIGADSAKRYNNDTGLVLSRIAWIGAVVFLVVGVALLLILMIFAWPLVDIMLQYMWQVMREESAQTALLSLT